MCYLKQAFTNGEYHRIRRQTSEMGSLTVLLKCHNLARLPVEYNLLKLKSLLPFRPHISMLLVPKAKILPNRYTLSLNLAVNSKKQNKT